MIDSLEMVREQIDNADMTTEFELDAKKYAGVTLHRPSIVDLNEKLQRICQLLHDTAQGDRCCLRGSLQEWGRTGVVGWSDSRQDCRRHRKIFQKQPAKATGMKSHAAGTY